jgi:hypothetical protein
MAKPISRRSAEALGTFTSRLDTPGRVVVPVLYFSPPKGINTLAPLSQVPNEYGTVVSNMMLDRGRLRSRTGVEPVGLAAASQVVAVVPFKSPNTSGALFRLRTDSMDRWNGTSWGAVVGMAFSGNLRDRFTWTGWGDQINICNGVDKIKALDVASGVITTLEESFPAKHITSFNGRIIATATTEGAFLGYRIRWCTKNDNTDWTSETPLDGLGAGYEDILATPGGYVDEAMGTFPISDEIAIIVRENSLWQMSVTGNFDAPFRFSRLYDGIGSRARYSICSTPYGVVFLSLDNVVVANQGGYEEIGHSIRSQLRSEITDFLAVTGAYDPRRQEYRLHNGADVWRYSFVDKGWTKDSYPFTLRHLAFVDYRSLGITFDELAGTMDDLAGTFDELGIASSDEAVHMVVAGEDIVVHEVEGTSQDNEVDSTIELRTGLLASGSPLNKTEIIEAQIEYECDEIQELIFDYSYDKGATWTQYSIVTINQTTGPKVTAVRKTLESHNLQIRVRSTKLGKLTLYGLHLFVVSGARVNP